MTPTPSPPFEWDEDKRQQNIELHGIDFTLAHHANWATRIISLRKANIRETARYDREKL